MASGRKTRYDFNAWPGLDYVIDANLLPDTFFHSAFDGKFHIGPGTDVHARLFWLKLTKGDRAFLHGLHIDPDG